MLEIRYHPKAVIEASKHARYYDRCLAGLGASFFDELDCTVQAVQQNPGLCPQIRMECAANESTDSRFGSIMSPTQTAFVFWQWPTSAVAPATGVTVLMSDGQPSKALLSIAHIACPL